MKSKLETRKILGTIVGVLAFIALVAGLTYAWFTWVSGNTIIAGTSDCFNITYANGQAISGEMTPTSTYNGEGSKSTTVTLGIEEGCLEGTGTIKFTVNSSTNMPLEKGAIKYAVYNGASEVSTGTINPTLGADGNFPSIDLASNLVRTTTPIEYTIYIWVDEVLVDTDFINKNFSGYIHASAQQNPDN